MKAKKEILIGVYVIIAAAILIFGINFLKGVNIFKAANYYYATYTDVNGLAQSAPVTLNGYKIGLVREINYDYNNPGHVTIEFSVDKELQLPKGSKATLASDLLGTATIALAIGNPADGYYAIGDTIATATKSGLMDALSNELMPSISSIFPKIDTLLANINAIVADPALTAGVKRLDAITAEVEASVRSLHSVMTAMGPIAKDLKSITGNADSIAANFAQVSATVKDMPLDSIVADLQSTIAHLNTLSEQLANPDGTLGKITGDPALYNNVNATVQSLDSLLIDIKQNPKRYINIKVF